MEHNTSEYHCQINIFSLKHSSLIFLWHQKYFVVFKVDCKPAKKTRLFKYFPSQRNYLKTEAFLLFILRMSFSRVLWSNPNSHWPQQTCTHVIQGNSSNINFAFTKVLMFSFGLRSLERFWWMRVVELDCIK